MLKKGIGYLNAIFTLLICLSSFQVISKEWINHKSDLGLNGPVKKVIETKCDSLFLADSLIQAKDFMQAKIDKNGNIVVYSEEREKSFSIFFEKKYDSSGMLHSMSLKQDSRQYNNYRYLYNQKNLLHEVHVQYAGEKNFHIHKTYSYFDNGKTKQINYLTHKSDIYRSESFEYINDTFLSSKINNSYEKDSIVEFQITTYEYDSLNRLCRKLSYEKLEGKGVIKEIVCYYYHGDSDIRKRTLNSFFSENGKKQGVYEERYIGKRNTIISKGYFYFKDKKTYFRYKDYLFSDSYIVMKRKQETGRIRYHLKQSFKIEITSEYDSYGNWIKRIEKVGGKIRTIDCRVIEYYID